MDPQELAETKRKALGTFRRLLPYVVLVDIADFLEHEGPHLQKQLLDLQASAKTSWLEGFWDTMYALFHS